MLSSKTKYKRICWCKSGKFVELSDGTERMTLDEFRAYAGVDPLYRIDEAIAKVNAEDRIEFVSHSVRAMAASLRERSVHGDDIKDTLIDRDSIGVCDTDVVN